ncbi:MAG: hypothetical protein GXO25_08160 [Euryarchaeota archaeon]|nr:hypothetical protein [Euryarchaeota archaeon]
MIKMFRIDGIEAKRYIEPENAPKEIRIDNNSTVLSISQLNENEARMEFRFTVSYAGIGVITMEGTVIYAGKVKELMNEWSKKHRMPDEVAQEVHATIINNCVLESVLLAKEVRLPPPIPPPAQMMNSNKGVKHKNTGPPEGYA